MRVKRQVAAGVTIVSDGELGKVGYSTYIIERLDGLRRPCRAQARRSISRRCPSLRKKLAAIMGNQEFIRAACVGPVRLKTLEPLHDDIRRFRARSTGTDRRARLHECRLARA